MKGKFRLRDIKRLHWAATILLSLARGFLSASYAPLIFMGSAGELQSGAGFDWSFYFTFAAVWAFVGPLALTIWWLFLRLFPIGGLIWLPLSLLICLTDPIIYFVLRSLRKKFVIVGFSFMNFVPFVPVLKPTKEEWAQMTRQRFWDGSIRDVRAYFSGTADHSTGGDMSAEKSMRNPYERSPIRPGRTKPCPKCGGDGDYQGKPCKACDGTGSVRVPA